MNKSLNFSLKTIKKSLYIFLHRFHVVLFVIVILGGLVIAIFLLNETVVTSGESGDYTPATNSTSFDQATIKRIEELKTSNQGGGNLDLSGRRINPFVE